MKRQSGFLARSLAGEGGRGGEDLIRKAGMRGPLCSRIAQTVEGPSALLSSPPFSLLLFWAGPGTLLPSRNCHPTQSFVSRSDVQGLPFVSPSTRCPSLLLSPSSFATLLCPSFSPLFHVRALSSFRRLVFFLGAPFRRFPAASALTLLSHVFFSPV